MIKNLPLSGQSNSKIHSLLSPRTNRSGQTHPGLQSCGGAAHGVGGPQRLWQYAPQSLKTSPFGHASRFSNWNEIIKY